MEDQYAVIDRVTLDRGAAQVAEFACYGPYDAAKAEKMKLALEANPPGYGERETLVVPLHYNLHLSRASHTMGAKGFELQGPATGAA